jgi:hypothetical protein
MGPSERRYCGRTPRLASNTPDCQEAKKLIPVQMRHKTSAITPTRNRSGYDLCSATMPQILHQMAVG